MFEWLLTGLSLIGTWFNIQKNILGWVIWAVANTGWMISFARKGMLPEATLFTAYLLLCIYGFVKWLRNEKRQAEGGLD